MDGWELAAREEIRHTIVAYNFGTDRGALDEVAACFTEDGVLELARGDRAEGRDAIVAMLSGVGPNAGRDDAEATEPAYLHHHVTNTHFRSLTETAADVTSYFFVVTSVGPDHWGRYRDRLVCEPDGRWRFAHRLAITDGFAPASLFRGP